jgi:predicted nucleic acid-binding protein
MNQMVLLDTGVLGNVTNPKAKNSNNVNCLNWLISLPSREYEVAIPEISDYLLRANKFNGIRQLDLLKAQFTYLPITTPTVLLAAKLWAEVRQSGQATADPKSLDGDVILAAQALLQAQQGYEVIVATTNVKHISRFVDARLWTDI